MYKLTTVLNINGQIILVGNTTIALESLAIKAYRDAVKKAMADLAKEKGIESSISQDTYRFSAKIIDNKTNSLKALKIELYELN